MHTKIVFIDNSETQFKQEQATATSLAITRLTNFSIT